MSPVSSQMSDQSLSADATVKISGQFVLIASDGDHTAIDQFANNVPDYDTYEHPMPIMRYKYASISKEDDDGFIRVDVIKYDQNQAYLSEETYKKNQLTAYTGLEFPYDLCHESSPSFDDLFDHIELRHKN